MIDIKSLTDVELTTIFRGVSLLNNCKLSLSEKTVSIRLKSELADEVNKRMIETTPMWK